MKVRKLTFVPKYDSEKTIRFTVKSQDRTYDTYKQDILFAMKGEKTVAIVQNSEDEEIILPHGFLSDCALYISNEFEKS